MKEMHPKASSRSSIVLLFRYGLRAHAELHQIIPELLHNLAKDCDVIYAGPRCGGLTIEGVRLHTLPYSVDRSRWSDKLWKTVWWYACLPALALRCRLWKASLIWIDESLPLFGWIVQNISGRPTVVTVVDFFLEVYGEIMPWLRPVARWSLAFERRSWMRSAAIVTRTISMKKYLQENGVDGEKIRMIRDAFSADVFAPGRSDELRRQLGFGADDLVLVHHGILHPNKGVGQVLSWLAPEMKANPRLKFLVVGDGQERKALEETVKKHGLESAVVFTGWLPSSREVADHLRVGDIGLVMRVGQFSDHFHVTGTLVHCLMCGLPVLAARLRGICEIVKEGEVGMLFDPSDSAEFLHKLSELGADAARRSDMGTRGRIKALNEFSQDRVLAETESLLRECLEKCIH
jgi:glycosyltransferase involved in cell wall biosynthesis